MGDGQSDGDYGDTDKQDAQTTPIAKEAETESNYPEASHLAVRCRLMLESAESAIPVSLMLNSLQDVVRSAIAVVQEQESRRLHARLDESRAEDQKEQFDAQPTPVENKIDPEAIGRSVADRACPTGSCAWTHTVANIVAEEIRKAMGKADEAKDELIRRLREDIRAFKDIRDAAGETKADVTPHQCKWWSKTVCNHSRDGHNPCYWDGDTVSTVSDCKYFEAKEGKEEADTPAEAPSETDEGASSGETLVCSLCYRQQRWPFANGNGCPYCKGQLQNIATRQAEAHQAPIETDEDAMVCAISIYFLDHTEATIMQLAELAEVPEKQIRRYVKSASHLIYSMQVVVRLIAATKTPQTPKGE